MTEVGAQLQWLTGATCTFVKADYVSVTLIQVLSDRFHNNLYIQFFFRH